MADNTTLNPGTGGDVIVTEQPGGAGAKIPVSKIYTGALDVNGGPVTSTNPFDVRISDATNTATVKAASTAAGATDKALVVAVSPNNTVAVTGTFFQGTQPVSGTITANIGTSGSLALDASVSKLTIAQSTALGSNTQTLIGGSVTTAAPTYTTGNINPLSLTTTGLLRIDGSGVTQPVSGTVTANAGTGTFGISGTVTANIGTSGSLALDATLTGGTQRTKITDGTNNAAVKAASTAAAATDPALVVAISPNNTIPVSGTFFQATQPVSGTVTANIGTSGLLALESTQVKLTIAQSTALGSNTQVMVGGSVTTAAPTYTTGNINPLSITTTGLLRIDGSGVTQPISGTITANIGTSGSLALDATLTGGTQRSKITDGTNNAAVKAASTAAAATDPALVVAISPNNTIPVSGSITANIGTSGSLALDSTLTGGTQSARVTDGTNVAKVTASSTAAAAVDNALVVNISPNTPAIKIAQQNATSSNGSVAASITTVTIIAANSNRRGLTLYNDSTSIVYILFGSPPSSASFTIKMQGGDYYEVPFGYTGVLNGIWVAANGAIRYSEISV